MDIDQTTHDHTALEHAAQAFARAVREDPGGSIDDSFQALSAALLGHMADEERGLFPYIQKNAPGWDDEVAALLEEHREIRRVHQGLRDAITAPQREGLADLVKRFIGLLDAHSLHEADVLAKTYTQLFPEKFAGG